MADSAHSKSREDDIAVVGMAIDVPGASSVAEYWANLRGGVESIRRLDEEQLKAAGEKPGLIARDNYVPAAAPLDGFDEFDAEFFGFSPKEAAILDPQHRKFLETAWHALEDAGHTPKDFGGRIGVYAGCGMGSYFYFNICSNPDLVEDVGMFLLRHTGNDKDFLSTRVSHIFDLKGPSINLQTACSTSLVAVHQAVRALRAGDCDMALAGGVTIELPQGRGYLYKDNEILSPDGHCHAFDHRAQGTVFGSGAGTVALRRLSDAIAEGDHIWAVIKGSAVNNDGAAKAGYLAPSLDGQAAAVRAALADAGVSADTVGYVECHGTGTYLGDPIEVAALSQAFGGRGPDGPHCRIGSVKSNIGHLDTAAGVAGLIKAALALHNAEIPPSLNYEAPNPAIDFASSPFSVADSLAPWTTPEGRPRRASVNSLGVGGTNAHVVLEEPPRRAASEDGDWPYHVLCLSGRSKKALEANRRALAAHLRSQPDLPLADVAWSLKQGRRGFEKRSVLVAETSAEAAELLDSGDTTRVFTHDELGPETDVVFMFPGGGAQYPDMAHDLYETEPVFAEWVDRGFDHLEARLEHDLRALWLPEPELRDDAARRLMKPSVQLPLLMILEYALARLWMSWGVQPAVLVGHSMGENTAACLAGVMSFEDCIDLVLLRGQLFDTVPAGGMLSIAAPLDEVRALAGDDLDIASVNAPALCAVSGPQDRLDAFAEVLDARGLDWRRVPIDIAAHSRMLDPILDEFRGFLRSITLSPPTIGLMSNRSGKPMTAEQATDPDYWVAQLRNTVMFGDCIADLADRADRVFLEVGPGKALGALARMNPAVGAGRVMSSLRHPDEDIADDAYFIGVLGRLWACGVEGDWSQLWGEARRNRVALPTYRFQRARYFIAPGRAGAAPTEAELERRTDIADWGFRPVWRPRAANSDFGVTGAPEPRRKTWLLFMDEDGLAEAAAARLEHMGHRVVRVTSGDAFVRIDAGRYRLAPELGREGYELLIAALVEDGLAPDRIGHFWLVTGAERFRPGSSFFHRNMEHGFYSLLHLGQALGGADLPEAAHVTVFTNGAARVADEPLSYPEKATMAGPAGVIPREVPRVTCATIDLGLHTATAHARWPRTRGRRDSGPDRALIHQVLEELFADPANSVAALRGGRRYEQSFVQAPLTAAEDPAFRDHGTYLITGGLGGIGAEVARQLAERHRANVVLATRRPLPPRDGWDAVLREAAPGDATVSAIRRIRDIEARGGQVLAMTADVCNLERMRRLVTAAQDRFGKIDGVIHAAGVIDDGPLLARDIPQIENVLAPKIDGLRVLEELFPDGALDLFVLFSSTSTAIRAAGQVDYVAANEYLNAWARARAGGRTRVVAVDWGVWADVGMAARAVAGHDGADQISQPVELDLPLLKSAAESGNGVRLVRADLQPGTDWVLDQHRTADGTAVLPGTGTVELMAEALTVEGITAPFEIRDLHFLRPFLAEDGVTRRAIVRLARAGEDGLSIELRSDCTVDGRAATQLHAEARVHPAVVREGTARISPQEILARCPDRQEASAEAYLATPQERHLRFGPHWHVLRETARGASEGIARLVLPESLRAPLDAGMIVHPGLLDLATGWAIDLAPVYRSDCLWVPMSYGMIRVNRTLPAEIFSWVRPAGGGGRDIAAFDVTVCDAHGNICAEIEDFRMMRLDEAAGFRPAPPTARDVEFDAPAKGAGTASRSPGEDRLAEVVRLGIRPDEGFEALGRAIAQGQPQVIVSPLDLQVLIDRADEGAPAPGALDQGFDRPELDSDYVPPGTEIEKALAGLWEKLLGVSRVGIEDSFFDLGGHSLIAVRLCAAVNRLYGTDFPISVLAEAPTIRDWGERIAAETGRQDAGAGAEAPKAPAKAFTHLVTLRKHDGAGATPFFLVAGMFGNVLNLRHLAHLVGEERPVYGLQARGLVNDDAPHDTIEEAAADLIAELRQVQPQGPYLLGGFSGGGITAYEIARRLEAAGEDVSLLVLLDTPMPVRPALRPLDKALIKLAEFRRKGPGYLAEWLRNRLAWEMRKRAASGTPSDEAAGNFHNRKIEAAFRGAVARYRVQPRSGRTVLFRPALDRHWKVSRGGWVSAEREYVLPDNGWTPFLPSLEVVEVPGNHDSMVLVPNVGVLAARMKTSLAAALGEQTSAAGRMRVEAAE